MTLRAPIPTRLERDRLFDALDGLPVRLGQNQWSLRVYGVIDADGGRWVQLALEGADRRVLTLRISELHGPRDAARTLSAWLSNPGAHSQDVPAHFG